MTHRTDCTVTESARDTVERVAELHADGKGAAGIPEEQGWELAGRGFGRVVYRIPSEEQVGPRETATEQSPCVIKFASSKGGRPATGQSQNRKEISQFKSLPRDLTEPVEGDPIFVPVKDWDEEDDLWLSMPEVDAEGGTRRGVIKRLDRAGWRCEDIKHDNVGWMHDVPVILDYGFHCEQTLPALERAQELGDILDRRGAQAVTVNDTRDGAEIDFLPPERVTVNEPPETTSAIFVEAERGIEFMELGFGTWDTRVSYDPSLEVTTERVVEAVEDDWIGVRMDVREVRSDTDLDVVFEVILEPVGGDPVPPEIAGEIWEDVVDNVEEELPMAAQLTPAEAETAVVTAIEEETRGLE